MTSLDWWPEYGDVDDPLPLVDEDNDGPLSPWDPLSDGVAVWQ